MISLVFPRTVDCLRTTICGKGPGEGTPIQGIDTSKITAYIREYLPNTEFTLSQKSLTSYGPVASYFTQEGKLVFVIASNWLTARKEALAQTGEELPQVDQAVLHHEIAHVLLGHRDNNEAALMQQEWVGLFLGLDLVRSVWRNTPITPIAYTLGFSYLMSRLQVDTRLKREIAADLRVIQKRPELKDPLLQALHSTTAFPHMVEGSAHLRREALTEKQLGEPVTLSGVMATLKNFLSSFWERSEPASPSKKN